MRPVSFGVWSWLAASLSMQCSVATHSRNRRPPLLRCAGVTRELWVTTPCLLKHYFANCFTCCHSSCWKCEKAYHRCGSRAAPEPWGTIAVPTVMEKVLRHTVLGVWGCTDRTRHTVANAKLILLSNMKMN